MRVKSAVARHKRKKRILKKTEGYWGRRHSGLRLGIEAVHTAQKYAYRDRKRRKRDFRRLWIVRIGAAARSLGLTYSRLVAGLRRANVAIDRKILADMAVREPRAFAAVCAQARAALEAVATA